MRYAPVRAILSSNAPSVASVSRFWRSYSTSPTRPTASNVTTTKSPATRTLRRCQSRSRGNWFAGVDVTAAMIARVDGYRLVEGNSRSPQHGIALRRTVEWNSASSGHQRKLSAVGKNTPEETRNVLVYLDAPVAQLDRASD